jgi:predicted N-acetyltransferase YhbS
MRQAMTAGDRVVSAPPSGSGVPDEAFMALELEPGILLGRAGRVRYHSAFGNV